MDKELEQKDDKLQFFDDKIGTPDSEVVEEMNRLDIKKYQVEKKMIGL